MIRQSRLNAAPAVALVASFVAVFALGELLAPDGDPMPASEGMSVIKEPDGLRIELHRVRGGTSFSNEDVEATITGARHGELVQVCLTLPDGMKIADMDWRQLSDPIRTFCRVALQDRDVQVRLERK